MWTTREEYIFVELYEAKLTVPEIASRLDQDEGSVQERISETQLQQVTWTEDDDDLLESLWRQDVPVENIRVQLAYPRYVIAICIRAYQLGLPRRSTESDGAEYTGGPWTATGDAYILKGVADGLSDETIKEKYFPNTRSVQDIRSRRLRLQNDHHHQQQQTSIADSPLPTNATSMLPAQVSHPSLTLRPTQKIREVYTHMIIYHLTLPDDENEAILTLMEQLNWPPNVQVEQEIATGPIEGLQSTWTNADNQFLVALCSDYGLGWKEIADTFFVDRLEEELRKQYELLRAGGVDSDPIMLD